MVSNFNDSRLNNGDKLIHRFTIYYEDLNSFNTALEQFRILLFESGHKIVQILYDPLLKDCPDIGTYLYIYISKNEYEPKYIGLYNQIEYDYLKN